MALTGIACVAMANWSWALKLSFLSVILAGSAREIRRLALLATPASVAALSFSGSQVRVWRRQDAADSDGVLCTVRHRYVHSRVVILALKSVTPGPGYRLVLTRSMCGQDGFRRFKRFLLWELPEQAPTPV